MAIRITGMYSGLDTESIISELVSAQSAKKNSYVKAQTKLSWKMDAWKSLNTKIYNFYTNSLDNMRWQASFLKKATKVSNPNAVSVVASNSAVNGVQSVGVKQLARGGKLTGLDLGDATGSTKLKDLGISGNASFDVTVGGKTTKIELSGDMKISDVVSKLNDAGVKASFDDANHRFFISAATTGAAADFQLTADDNASLQALSALGILTESDIKNGEYATWAAYANDVDMDGNPTGAFKQAIDAEAARRAASYKAANDALEKKNDALNEELYGKDGNKDVPAEDSLYGKKAALEAQKDNETLTDDDRAAIDKQIEALDKTIQEKEGQITSNNGKIADNSKYYTVKEGDDGLQTIEASADLVSDVTDDLNEKVALAQSVVDGSYAGSVPGLQFANRTVGQDAVITLDGVEFTSGSNEFTINGMTITAYDVTQDDVTVTTTDDVDGIYNMIKDFFKEYNSLINEMNALYNADSAKGYEPLLSEEKAELADSEIEEWEKKIKDSLLRRDSTLGDVSDAMTTVLLQGATVNGKTMYLSDFGINTLGYFKAEDNERNAYHIDGDPDDASVKSEDDKLRSMISSDPDTVMNFFTSLANNLYDTLTDKMKNIKDTSSMFTVYNDLSMQKEYKEYTTKISEEEDRLNALMDKWYDKFSQMETAMAKLQSKSSGLGNLLGGS